MTGERTLLLMRHAKSGYPPGVVDHDRPLATRGIREAGIGGDWLRANQPRIDAVLCSTATRARETLANTGIDAPVQYRERLYDTTPGTMIDEINEVADGVDTLLVVGHEPTVSSLALGLAGAEGTDEDAVQRISEKFATSAIAVLSLTGDWKDLQPGGAALIDFHVPR
ncbi:histidine phosphatase family protein [Mycobacterium sp. Aquia_213]|nr:histidine phosphatase family protein [Mycobacterium sp. Aquia_213]WAC92918.1 histidine phosphatase family protein [Mycobacterium sp. Aquia_213]